MRCTFLVGPICALVIPASVQASSVVGTYHNGSAIFTQYDDGAAFVTYPCAQKPGETCWDRRGGWTKKGDKTCFTFLKYQPGREICL